MTSNKLLRNSAFQQSDVVVIGAGVSGLTTAIALQSCGLKPVIVADRNISGGDAPVSDVPSFYAMASAYPHHLQIENLAEITFNSQRIFGSLTNVAKSGVSRYVMYEVFEQEPEPAPLADLRMDFQEFAGTPQEFEDDGVGVNPPIRPGAKQIFGFRFQTCFADMPVYMRYLAELFNGQNGQIISEHVAPDTEFGGRPIVNCSGLGAVELFSDDADLVVMRGRQVLVPGAPMVTEGNQPVCFNYTPSPDVFRRADGNAEYVHFFPRHDGWILGQTREPGRLGADGTWVGDAVAANEVTVCTQSSLTVPEPILSLNHDLLRAWRNVTFAGRELQPREGYRYYRSPKAAGVRLEAEERDGKLVVHNYGHGGSGVTVSWGCAMRAAHLLLEHGGGKGSVVRVPQFAFA